MTNPVAPKRNSPVTPNRDKTVNTARKAPTAAQLADAIKAKGYKPKPKTASKPKTEAPTTPCPACGSDAVEIDRAALNSNTPNREIDAARADRAARLADRAGNYEEGIYRRDLSAVLRAQSVETPAATGPAKSGTETCPACGATNVTVDRAKLSPIGARRLRSSTASSIDAIREGKKRPKLDQVKAHNAKAKRLRDAELEARGMGPGGDAA
ncbi:hypothetical protein HH308_05045 [Gordonia sp. TBRC 11910]|uniref:Uncharacterized protein n=1 Tax=Gordonia asplenii TaxID=2725283 RepID=A0A848KQG4_9ACTN|nr:hypothetical protein [Gordonia asplenii]NMO00580.1 hypothetical protein [Gordonia asplenii]